VSDSDNGDRHSLRTQSIVVGVSAVLFVVVLVLAGTARRHESSSDWAAIAVIVMVVFASIVLVRRLVLGHRMRWWYWLTYLFGMLLVFLVSFSLVYFQRSDRPGSCMNERLSRTDAAYFTVTVFTTTGLGDIHPVTEDCRRWVTTQQLAGLTLTVLLFGAGVGAFVTQMTERQKRQRSASPSP
jgi:hypothetical protein